MTSEWLGVTRWVVLGCFVVLSACGGEGEQRAPLVSIAVSPPEAVVFVGETLELRAIGSFEGGKQEALEATWSSSDPAVGAVDPERLEFSALFPGEVTIQANAGGFAGTAEISVRARATVARVEPSTAHLLPGDSLALSWIAIDPSGVLVEGQPVWSSSDPTVASVDAEGVVRATGVGAATVHGTREGLEAAARVVVAPLPPARVEIRADETKLEVGATTHLEATVFDRDGGVMDVPVTWVSESPTVVSVGEEGKATLLRPAGGDVLALVGDTAGRIRLEGYLDYTQARGVGSGEDRSTCALDRHGRAYCWGANDHGQLGSGGKRPTSIPARVEGAPLLARLERPAGVTAPTDARQAFVGITQDGRLYGWGQGAPEGRWMTRSYQVSRWIERPWTDPTPGVAFAAGVRTCELTTKGAGICWGDRDPTPTQVVREGSPLRAQGDPDPLHEPIVQVAGARMFCWRYESGEVSCDLSSRWGDTQNTPIPLQEPAIDLVAARRSACALGESGAVYCWQRVCELVWLPNGGAPPSLIQECLEFTPALQARAPAPVTQLVATYDAICGATEVGWTCWKQHHAANPSTTAWLGEPEPGDFGGFLTLDPLSELAFDEDGILWHLTSPPTRARGQR